MIKYFFNEKKMLKVIIIAISLFIQQVHRRSSSIIVNKSHRNRDVIQILLKNLSIHQRRDHTISGRKCIQIGKEMPVHRISIVNIRKRHSNGAIDCQVHRLWAHQFKMHNGIIVIHRKMHSHLIQVRFYYL